MVAGGVLALPVVGKTAASPALGRYLTNGLPFLQVDPTLALMLKQSATAFPVAAEQTAAESR